MFVHVLLDAQAGVLTRAAMVPTKLLVGPLASFVAVVAGTWLMLYASRLSNPDGHGQIAILFEAAQPAEIAPLILQAYHLTKREGEVTQLILRGRSTREIAATMQISLNTVQDHLKAIFEKVNVGSRRELAGHIFAQQYQPHFTASAPLDVFGRLTSLDRPSSEDNIASS